MKNWAVFLPVAVVTNHCMEMIVILNVLWKGSLYTTYLFTALDFNSCSDVREMFFSG